MWHVLKFGGTSLAEASRYENACAIILKEHCERSCVVVSAPGSTAGLDKVTNLLYLSGKLATEQNKEYHVVVAALLERILTICRELFGAASLEFAELRREIESDFEDLRHILRTVWLCRGIGAQDWWTGYGEIWSAKIMRALISKRVAGCGEFSVGYVDARDVIVVKPHAMGNVPDMKASMLKLSKWFESHDGHHIIVATGYIASTDSGAPTTLGRDGSDYSASIFGALLKAKSVTIWTDVDGVYSANPSEVRSAALRPWLSYQEAMELAYFGAKVIHSKTMTPVVIEDIPIYIRNSFHPEHPGSCICSKDFISRNFSVDAAQRTCIQGLTCIRNLALVNVEGSGMIGVPGVARRLFQAVEKSQSSVVLITQAGSEHSICIAVPMRQCDQIVKAISLEFRDELELREIQTVEKIENCACLAVVGDNMAHYVGIAGKVFQALAHAGVNVRAIAQGSSERNISIIVDQDDVVAAMTSIHQDVM